MQIHRCVHNPSEVKAQILEARLDIRTLRYLCLHDIPWLCCLPSLCPSVWQHEQANSNHKTYFHSYTKTEIYSCGQIYNSDQIQCCCANMSQRPLTHYYTTFSNGRFQSMLGKMKTSCVLKLYILFICLLVSTDLVVRWSTFVVFLFFFNADQTENHLWNERTFVFKDIAAVMKNKH